MQKLFVPIIALALVAGAVSCKKEKVEHICTPVYQEGVYHPCQMIDTLVDEDGNRQIWLWSDNDLTEVRYGDDEVVTYNYANNLISSVTTIGGAREEIHYSYEGGKFSTCDIYYNSAKALSMALTHNEAGKISGADVTIENDFLLQLAGSLLGKGTAFEKIVGNNMAKSLVDMAKMTQNQEGAKFDIGDKNVTMTLLWNGENMTQQVNSASINLNVSADDIEFISQFIDIPEQYMSMIQLVMAMGGGNVPLQLSVNDTMTSTYDNKNNPLFCNWGEIFSPQNLSMNNVVTTTERGALSVGISMMGQTTNIYNQPIESYKEYIYEYNDKNYPTRVSGDLNVTYSYKK